MHQADEPSVHITRKSTDAFLAAGGPSDIIVDYRGAPSAKPGIVRAAARSS